MCKSTSNEEYGMEATGDKHCTMMRQTLYNDASFKVPLIIDNASARMLKGYGSCLVWVSVCNVRNVLPRFDESLYVHSSYFMWS